MENFKLVRIKFSVVKVGSPGVQIQSEIGIFGL